MKWSSLCCCFVLVACGQEARSAEDPVAADGRLPDKGAQSADRAKPQAPAGEPASASVEEEPEGPYLTGMLRGECRRLVVRGRDVSQGCTDEVMNTNYRSGRSGFTFGNDSVVVTFSGMDTPAVGDRAETHLDMVIVTRIGGMSPTPRNIDATGRCQYSNPNAGRSYVRCSARTEEGEFNADFLSNGEPVETLQ